MIFIVGVTVVVKASQDLPSVDTLNQYQPPASTTIYAADGSELGKIYKENRTWISIKDIPKDLKNAIIAIEDTRFYKHHGVDIIGIGRAALAFTKKKGEIQGGSTITQQLARNLFLTQDVTIERKIKEAIIAYQIERKFSKDEILEFYLNQIYFGAGAYGIEAASQTYFGKRTSQLTLSEAAMLAGLPQAPSAYDPFTYMEKAKARQAIVLGRMATVKFITEEEKSKAAYAELKFSEQITKKSFHGYKYPYFTTYVITKLFEMFNPDLIFKGGLKVYTTIDPQLQELSQKYVKEGIDTGLKEGLRSHQGALVAVEPGTGYIVAMAGGYSFSTKDQFNRAWQAKRQPGSAFKIIVYTAAVDNGTTPSSIVMDTPIAYPQADGKIWAPRNDDGKFWGSITLRHALTWSRNVVAVRLVERVGLDNVIKYAKLLGIKEPLEKNMSLALGSGVVTPLEMATVAATLANEGIYVEPSPFKTIQDINGNVIFDNTLPNKTEAVPANTARIMTDMMKDVIEKGTGTRAKIGRASAGKTGTTSDFRDAWFVGFTPDLSAAVWIGNDDYKPMVIAYGGYIPAIIWGNFMKGALNGKPKKEFISPYPVTKSKVEPLPKRIKSSTPSPENLMPIEIKKKKNITDPETAPENEEPQTKSEESPSDEEQPSPPQDNQPENNPPGNNPPQDNPHPNKPI